MLQGNKLKLLTTTVLVAFALTGCDFNRAIDDFFGKTRTLPDDAKVDFGAPHTPVLNPGGSGAGSIYLPPPYDAPKYVNTPPYTPVSPPAPLYSGSDVPVTPGQIPASPSPAARRAPIENGPTSTGMAPVGPTSMNAPAAPAGYITWVSVPSPAVSTSTMVVTDPPAPAQPAVTQPVADANTPSAAAPSPASDNSAYPALANVPPSPKKVSVKQSKADFKAMNAEQNQAEASRQNLMNDPNATVMTAPDGQLRADATNVPIALMPQPSTPSLQPPGAPLVAPVLSEQDYNAQLSAANKPDTGFFHWVGSLFSSDTSDAAPRKMPVENARYTAANPQGAYPAQAAPAQASPVDASASVASAQSGRRAPAANPQFNHTQPVTADISAPAPMPVISPSHYARPVASTVVSASAAAPNTSTGTAPSVALAPGGNVPAPAVSARPVVASVSVSPASALPVPQKYVSADAFDLAPPAPPPSMSLPPLAADIEPLPAPGETMPEKVYVHAKVAAAPLVVQAPVAVSAPAPVAPVAPAIVSMPAPVNAAPLAASNVVIRTPVNQPRPAVVVAAPAPQPLQPQPLQPQPLQLVAAPAAPAAPVPAPAHVAVGMPVYVPLPTPVNAVPAPQQQALAPVHLHPPTGANNYTASAAPAGMGQNMGQNTGMNDGAIHLVPPASASASASSAPAGHFLADSRYAARRAHDLQYDEN